MERCRASRWRVIGSVGSKSGMEDIKGCAPGGSALKFEREGGGGPIVVK